LESAACNRIRIKSRGISISAVLKYLKETIKLILASIYAIYLYLSPGKTMRIILCYHNVNNQDTKHFRKQMELLVNKKYRIVKVSEIMTAASNDAHVVVGITFDDALVSAIENALPVLEELSLPATIFVPTGNLGRPPQWPFDNSFYNESESVITEKQIAELDKNGFEIFSHTVSHPFLTKVGNDKLRRELVESKQALEKIVGHEVIGLSYPHGDYNAEVCKTARAAGYRLGFSIEPCTVNRSPSDLAIGRFLLSANDSLLKFKLNIMGAYQITNYLCAIKGLILGILRPKTLLIRRDRLP